MKVAVGEAVLSRSAARVVALVAMVKPQNN